VRKTIDDVGRILGEIAEGNLAVDVTQNESYYIGDFEALLVSLKLIHANLVHVIRDISCVAKQVDISAERVSTGAQALSQGTMEQAASIDGLVANVTEITSQLQSSTVRCGSASELVDKVTGYAAEAAQDTNGLIERSIQDVKTGTESTDLAVCAMRVISDCIRSVKALMDEIASASVQQSEMISSIEQGIREISTVVQTNSSTADRSAAVSKELSGQARTLNQLLGRFNQSSAAEVRETDAGSFENKYGAAQ
jgi:methyl-accepting chemotaxis protein